MDDTSALTLNASNAGLIDCDVNSLSHGLVKRDCPKATASVAPVTSPAYQGLSFGYQDAGHVDVGLSSRSLSDNGLCGSAQLYTKSDRSIPESRRS